MFTTWSKWKLKSQTKTNAALYCEGGKMHSLEPLARQPKIGFYLVTSHGQVVHSREERGVLCLVAYLRRLVLSYFVLECWLAWSTRQRFLLPMCDRQSADRILPTFEYSCRNQQYCFLSRWLFFFSIIIIPLEYFFADIVSREFSTCRRLYWQTKNMTNGVNSTH